MMNRIILRRIYNTKSLGIINKKSFLTGNSYSDNYFKNEYTTFVNKIENEKRNELKQVIDQSEYQNYELLIRMKNQIESDNYEDVIKRNIVNDINLTNLQSFEKFFTIHQKYWFKSHEKLINLITSSNSQLVNLFSGQILLIIIILFITTKILLKERKTILDSKTLIKRYLDSQDNQFTNFSVLPNFHDHKNISNLIVHGRNVLIVGPKGVGKTHSVLQFCKNESENGSVVLYFNSDLLEKNIHDYNHYIVSKLINNVKNQKDIIVEGEKFTEDTFNELKSRKTYVVFDQLTSINYEKHVSKFVEIFKTLNSNIILISNTSELSENVLKDEFAIKNVDDKMKEKVQNYILENFNSAIKTNVKSSNCELISETMLETLKSKFYINFNLLVDYLNSNTSFENFIEKQKLQLKQKIEFLKFNDKECFFTLKDIVERSSVSKSDWNKFSQVTNYQHLIQLEELSFISIRNINEIRVLNKEIKNLI